MIISCEKCNKKFEISDDLIPSKGRILQCGSCLHKWHFVPIDEDQPAQKIQKIDETDDSNENLQEEAVKKNDTFKKSDVKKDKKVGFLSYLLVFIISFIALIIIAETFEPLILLYLPGFDFYLSSLHESLKDIFLFFKDLIN